MGKPLGRPTRGKTTPNRLRKTDAFLAVAFPAFVRRLPGLYVDLGYGAYPVTTAETFRRLRRADGEARVLGVEIDPARVAEAQRYAAPGLEFRHGGFELPLQPGDRVAVIRAFNVLRQYDEAAVAGALTALSASLAEGGLLIEGTSDPHGRLLAFNLFRKAGGLERGGVVLAPRLGADFAPRALRAVLPKAFIHHAEPAGAIDRFFAAWDAAWQRARGGGARTPRRRFVAAALGLAERSGYALDRREALLRRGFLWLGPSWPERG
jgi:SAM-dependent methyltransferase